VSRRICGCSSKNIGATTLVTLALIPFTVLFLQFPVSLPLWNLLPKLRFLQYPWRWLLVLEAPMALFFAAAVWPRPAARPWRHLAVAALCALAFLGSTAIAARTFLRACDADDTIPNLLALYQSPGGHEGTDEYEPAGSDHWQIATGLPDACLSADADTTLGAVHPGDSIPGWEPNQGACDAAYTAQVRQPEHRLIAATTPHAGFLILRLLSYPAWRIRVNGRPATNLPERDDGLIAVPVPQGAVTVTIDWTATPDVVAGRWLSAAAGLLLAGLALLERKHASGIMVVASVRPGQ